MKYFSLRSLLSAVALVSAVLVGVSTSDAKERVTGRGTGPVVYVISQDLYYDSIVLADLPFDGTDNWQLLDTTPDHQNNVGLETEFGPGDQDYYGGRWFIDMDADEEPSEGDVFFLCPLLGPGYDFS